MYKVFFSVLILLLPANNASAFKRFEPQLRKNLQPEICLSFHKTLQKSYTQGLAIDWKKTFPEKQILKIPASGYFSERDSYFLRLRTNEYDENIYYFTAHRFAHGYKYSGGNLHKAKDDTRTIKDFKILNQAITKTGQLPEDKLSQYFEPYASISPSQPLYLIADGEKVYQISPDWSSKPSNPNYFYALTDLSSNKNKVICSVLYTPSEDHYNELKELKAIQALKNVYGGIGNTPVQRCYGTLGWTAPAFMSSIITAYEHPEKIKETHKKRLETAFGGQRWHESLFGARIAFIYWGTQDPQSWKAVQEIHQYKPEFIQHISQYYIQELEFSKQQAEEMAEQSWLYILNTIYYNKYLLAVPFEPDDIDVKDMSIRDLVQLVHIKSSGNHEDLGKYGIEKFLTDNYLALIYTRSDPQLIDKAHSDLLNLANNGDIFRKQHFADTMNLALLASLGNKDLMETALSYGADINKETNDFKKTPLMYAAQLSNLTAVKWLLDNGAEVNKTTLNKKYSCEPIERDSRTALMYAAENANEEVIRLLLEHGADPKALDSKQNNILWYLDKNTVLSLNSKKELHQKLTKLIK